MYNLMMIGKNEHHLIKIMNCICEKLEDIRVYNISHDFNEVLNILEKQTIDIILIDLESNEMEYMNLIKYINEHNFYKYKESIIVKLNKDKMLQNTKNSYVFFYAKGIENLIRDLKRLIINKNNRLNLDNMKNKINQELIYLGYNYSYNGTKYLEEAILEIYKVRVDFDGNIAKNIYSIIAKEHQKSIDTIYGNIKQATNIMISKCAEEKIVEYFNYSYYIKPKIKEIIFTVLNKVATKKNNISI